MRLHSVLVLALVGAAACTSSDQSTVPEAVSVVPYDRLEVLAAARYGNAAGVVYEPSEAGTHVLVQYRSASSPQQPLVTTSYFVYAVPQDRVVFEEQAIQGTVEWRDGRYLRVHLTPGIVPVEGVAPTTYLIDVRTGRRVAE